MPTPVSSHASGDVTHQRSEDASRARLHSIQCLRALAAWLVVGHHIHFFFRFRVTSPLGWFLSEKGSVGVDIFFVISGLVMALSTSSRRSGGGQFMWRRLVRIAPAYWVATTLMVLLLLARPSLMNLPFRLDAWHLVLSYSFLSSLSTEHFFPVLIVGWSLNFEMLFYLMLAASLWGAQRIARGRAELLILPAIILAFVFLYPASFPFSAMLSSGMLLLFLAGYLLGVLLDRGRVPMTRMLGTALLIGGVVIIASTAREEYGLRAVGCGSIVWGALVFEAPLARLRWIHRLGDWSYSTYLLHVLMILLSQQAWEAFTASSVSARPGFVVLAMLGTLAGSIVMYRLVERPSLRAIGRRSSDTIRRAAVPGLPGASQALDAHADSA
jgi:exopolysaccharide production protein ExoZ